MKSYQGAVKLEKLLNIQPDIITNDRLHPDFPGDTKTPEQGIPKWDQIEAGENWETCMTMNNSWGYKSFDNKWKSSEQLIRNLVKIAARGGNYLLNVGPEPDGTFPDESIDRLKEIGRWMDINGEAIYNTQASPFGELPWGECTSKKEAENTVLYFSVFDWPTDGKLKIPALKNKVVSAKFLANGEKVKTSATHTGLEIFVPQRMPDSIATVIQVEVKGEVKQHGLSKKKEKMQSGALD
jgi:alpha-L-fucosidase